MEGRGEERQGEERESLNAKTDYIYNKVRVVYLTLPHRTTDFNIRIR